MSVGHVARLMEEAGIPTVIVAVAAFKTRLQTMSLPRLLLTPFPMGRPLGRPGNIEQQREIVCRALRLLEESSGPGAVINIEMPY